MPKTTLIAVPPGVGDIYWALTKLESIRSALELEHVTLCIQHSRFPRSLEWKDMVDFVDDTRFLNFLPGVAQRDGYQGRSNSGVEMVLWPNAVMDRGEHVSTWLPQYACNLDIKIKTELGAVRPPGDVVLFVSSPTTKIWFPNTTPAFWLELAERLGACFGKRPLLIGAEWDKGPFADSLRSVCDSVIGETTLPQVAGILESALCVVGVASGMTILANHFRTPCVALFPDKHHPNFPWTWKKPDMPYAPLFARELVSASKVALTAAALTLAL